MLVVHCSRRMGFTDLVTYSVGDLGTLAFTAIHPSCSFGSLGFSISPFCIRRERQKGIDEVGIWAWGWGKAPGGGGAKGRSFPTTLAQTGFWSYPV
jgi:hypothetical protein